MSVKAVLNEATNGSSTGESIINVTPTPAPDSMIGSPTSVPYATAIDLVAGKVQFSYHVYQTYNTASGGIGMAQTSGTSDWISIPNVSRDFPNVSLSVTPASAIVSGSVKFTINSTVSYTKIKPGVFDLQTV